MSRELIPCPKFSDGVPLTSSQSERFIPVLNKAVIKNVLLELTWVAVDFINNRNAEELDSNFILESLPRNYQLYYEKRELLNRSRTLLDIVIIGHPSGNPYHSLLEFAHHLDWLYRDKKHDRQNCRCTFCGCYMNRINNPTIHPSGYRKQKARRTKNSNKEMRKENHHKANQYGELLVAHETKIEIPVLDPFPYYFTMYFGIPILESIIDNVVIWKRQNDDAWNVKPLIELNVKLKGSEKQLELVNVVLNSKFQGQNIIDIDDLGIWVSFQSGYEYIKEIGFEKRLSPIIHAKEESKPIPKKKEP